MGTYVPNTAADREIMLKACAMERMEDLYAGIPEALKIKEPLAIPEGGTEMEVSPAIIPLPG